MFIIIMSENNNNGWIKLYRKLLDNPVICKNGDYLAVWIYLLLNATHEQYEVLFDNKRIILKAGQLITGRKIIATRLNTNEIKVQRILKTFENEQQIEQQTTNVNRLITIINWNEYQCSEQQIEQRVNNERTTSEQRVNTNNNIKNIKNEKNNIGDAQKNLHELQNLIIKEYPIIQKIKRQLSLDECLKLEKEFSRDEIKNILDAMENYKKTPSYNTVYLTIRKWINKERERNAKPIREKSIWEKKRELTMQDLVNAIETNPDFQ